ncbi:MAG: iron-containing alcohol dehydrogenase [Haliea sp.]|jgi:alcohol dehydrogenase class IV|nr:iron-containing alcohol dehydrogenase [Haliea sp.]
MSNTGYFQYNMRTVVHSGYGSIIRIPALLQGLGARRVLLISDAGLKQVGVVDRVAACFDTWQSGDMPVLAGIYPEITPDAGSSCVNACAAYAREVAADAILAVGGGSVLDASKGVKYALQHQLLDISEALQSGIKMEAWPAAQHSGIPHLTVPTTAGTGAEGSAGAVILNDETGIKGGIFAPFLDADIAVLDAQLTLGLPPGLTASTGMDALTHALEGVASPNANPFSDAHCMISAQLIERFLPRAVENGQDVEARTQMLNASCMAVNGYLAALNATPVHNCSHAFGAMYHVPHGDANGVFLPIVMETLPELYIPHAERLAQALNMPASDKTGADLLEDVIAKVRDIQQRVNCATDLSRWNVTADNMEAIVTAVATDPVAVFFPIPPEKIQEITLKAIG